MQGISLILAPYANYKTNGIRSFLSEVPENTRIFTFRITRPSVSYYAKNNIVKRAGYKGIQKALKTEEKIYLIAKINHKDDLQRNFTSFKILKEDQLYLYGSIE